MKKKLIVVALRVVLWKVVLWWCRTLRITKVGSRSFDELRAAGKNYVVVFWHGSMLVGWFLHRPMGIEKISALVSQSHDGEFLATVLERWGYTLIRGSSHIGGKEAMQLMIQSIADGSSLAITPDGPRGPRHEMKMGAVRAAQQTSAPLVLAGIALERKKFLHSWDKFEVPLPLSRAAVVYSEPIIVPKELNGQSLDEFKMNMQRQLNELTARAEEHLGMESS